MIFRNPAAGITKMENPIKIGRIPEPQHVNRTFGDPNPPSPGWPMFLFSPQETQNANPSRDKAGTMEYLYLGRLETLAVETFG